MNICGCPSPKKQREAGRERRRENRVREGEGDNNADEGDRGKERQRFWPQPKTLGLFTFHTIPLYQLYFIRSL